MVVKGVSSKGRVNEWRVGESRSGWVKRSLEPVASFRMRDVREERRGRGGGG